ncbi:hypothetical protein IAQ61_008957 [Plenodomus lingam]|uniref:uncharacterized protein n=1 Tax=Leptosphaeria maculans TaxID=5022 RepID=UPI0033174E06|nr:hypothetical protein IAQ61_008957 [Plenodomus lingam]
MTSDNPPTQYNGPDQPATAPAQDGPKLREFTPGCDLAIFSTELGTQAKRALEGQLRPPVIVRSDGVLGVVDAAQYWQRRFKVQCLCIFPGQDWTISDLWDPVDIQLDTSPFCQEMLKFISGDTYHAARIFAKDFIRAYPNRLSVLGKDMSELHTPPDPFSMVDKIYNEGERGAFPRTFLWHVAHMMRASVLGLGLVKPVGTTQDKSSACVPRCEDKKQEDVSDSNQDTLPQTEPIIASASPPSTIVEVTLNELASLVATAPLQPEQTPVSSHDLQGAGSQHNEPVECRMNRSTGHSVTSPTVAPQSLRLPKGPPRNVGTGVHPQPFTSHNWAENNYRPAYGQYPPRQTSGGMAQMTSPHFMASNMAIGQHMVPAGYVAPYPQGLPMMPANMSQMPHYNPAVVQSGMMVHPSAMMQNPQAGPVYAPQPHTVRGSSMGDMTNIGYYANTMSSHSLSNAASSMRRSSNYNANGTLFDPYNGTNSNFRETTSYKGKKPHYNDTPYQGNRPRNMSNSGSRPIHASYKAERAISQPYHSAPHSHRPKTRHNSEDDPSITENRLTGCHEQWIGPENVTVSELFVGDLPSDISAGEVQKMFEQQMSILPAHVSVRHPKRTEGFPHHDRCHAFVSLQSTADAKKVMGMRERNFRLRDDGHPVSVSVPRRFFQLPTEQLRRASSSSGSYFIPTPYEDRNGKATHLLTRDDNKIVKPSDASATLVKAVYSPQDARSGPHKKTDVRSNTDEDGTDETHRARKTKPRQISPTKKQHAKREGVTPKIPSAKGAKPVHTTAKDSTAVTPSGSNDKSTQRRAQDITISSSPASKKKGTAKKSVILPTANASLAEETPLSTTTSSTVPSHAEAAIGPGENESTAVKQFETNSAPSIKLEPTMTADVIEQPHENTVTEEESSKTAKVSSPKLPEHTAVNDKTPREEGSGTMIEMQAKPMPTESNQKKVERPTTSRQEKDVIKDVSELAPHAKLTAAIGTPQATSSTESGKDTASNEKTAPEIGTGSLIKSTTVSTAEIPAKPVVQQVSSLHPYAKPNKVQQKKAKDALRKQQKKEQAEKAEKAKLEKAKAEKAKIENTKVSTRREAAVLTENIEKSQDLSHTPILPNETMVEQVDMSGVAKGKLAVLANAAALAIDYVLESEPISDAAVPPIPPAERIPTNQAPAGIKKAKEHEVQMKVIAMAAEASTMKPQMEESQDSLINVTASEIANPASSEPATPTPKKKSKTKRKKAKVIPAHEENKQAEGYANGAQRDSEPDTTGLYERVRRGLGYGDHNQIDHERALDTPLYTPSDSQEPIIFTPPSDHPSEDESDNTLPLFPAGDDAHTDRQNASSPSPNTLIPNIVQPNAAEVAASATDMPAVETPKKKKKKNKKKNKNKSTSSATDSPAPASAGKLELHVTAGQSSSSSQNAGVPMMDNTKASSGLEDPLLALAAAATKEQKKDWVGQVTGGNVHYLITTTKNASLADVQAEYAAAGKKPKVEAYKLAEGDKVEDFLPSKLLPQNIEDYLRDFAASKDADKKKA